MNDVIPIYVAVTAHGFGHATRIASVIHELLKLDPDILPIFVTTTPRWLVEKYLQGRYLHRPRDLDVGVLQKDGLTMDVTPTLEALKDLKARSPQLIRAEVDFIRTNRVRLVYGDIPPLATAIAEAAGIPCWMEGNFGWDFIYRPFGEAFLPLVEWIEDLYHRCDRLFQLPMHEPMLAFPHRQLVGLTGGDPLLEVDQVRQEVGLDPQRPTVLLTFGGFGISNFPYPELGSFPDWQFISFDADAPDLPNLMRLDGTRWRPVDVMPACDRVVSKPGYGTISEALRVGVPLCCVTREGFAESQILMEGLRQYGRHQIISQEHFFNHPWEFLNQPVVEPQDPDGIDRQGNRTIAQEIYTLLRSG